MSAAGPTSSFSSTQSVSAIYCDNTEDFINLLAVFFPGLDITFWSVPIANWEAKQQLLCLAKIVLLVCPEQCNADLQNKIRQITAAFSSNLILIIPTDSLDRPLDTPGKRILYSDVEAFITGIRQQLDESVKQVDSQENQAIASDKQPINTYRPLLPTEDLQAIPQPQIALPSKALNLLSPTPELGSIFSQPAPRTRSSASRPFWWYCKKCCTKYETLPHTRQCRHCECGLRFKCGSCNYECCLGNYRSHVQNCHPDQVLGAPVNQKRKYCEGPGAYADNSSPRDNPTRKRPRHNVAIDTARPKPLGPPRIVSVNPTGASVGHTQRATVIIENISEGDTEQCFVLFGTLGTGDKEQRRQLPGNRLQYRVDVPPSDIVGFHELQLLRDDEILQEHSQVFYEIRSPNRMSDEQRLAVPETNNRYTLGERNALAAAAAGNVRGLETFLALGGSVDLMDTCQNSLLHFAVASGNEEAVQLLIECGARLDVINNARFTPCDISYEMANQRLCDLLTDAMAVIQMNEYGISLDESNEAVVDQADSDSTEDEAEYDEAQPQIVLWLVPTSDRPVEHQCAINQLLGTALLPCGPFIPVAFHLKFHIVASSDPHCNRVALNVGRKCVVDGDTAAVQDAIFEIAAQRLRLANQHTGPKVYEIEVWRDSFFGISGNAESLPIGTTIMASDMSVAAIVRQMGIHVGDFQDLHLPVPDMLVLCSGAASAASSTDQLDACVLPSRLSAIGVERILNEKPESVATLHVANTESPQMFDTVMCVSSNSPMCFQEWLRHRLRRCLATAVGTEAAPQTKRCSVESDSTSDDGSKADSQVTLIREVVALLTLQQSLLKQLLQLEKAERVKSEKKRHRKHHKRRSAHRSNRSSGSGDDTCDKSEKTHEYASPPMAEKVAFAEAPNPPSPTVERKQQLELTIRDTKQRLRFLKQLDEEVTKANPPPVLRGSSASEKEDVLVRSADKESEKAKSSFELLSQSKDEPRTSTEKQSVDLCFIIQFSRNMQSWVSLIEEAITDIRNALAKEVGSKLLIRLGFVGYRDFCEGPITVRPFTHSASAVTEFVHSLREQGGPIATGEAEGALEGALSLKWKGSTRVVIHIGEVSYDLVKYSTTEAANRAVTKAPRSKCDPLVKLAELASIRANYYLVDVHRSREERVVALANAYRDASQCGFHILRDMAVRQPKEFTGRVVKCVLESAARVRAQ